MDVGCINERRTLSSVLSSLADVAVCRLSSAAIAMLLMLMFAVVGGDYCRNNSAGLEYPGSGSRRVQKACREPKRTGFEPSPHFPFPFPVATCLTACRLPPTAHCPPPTAHRRRTVASMSTQHARKRVPFRQRRAARAVQRRAQAVGAAARDD